MQRMTEPFSSLRVDGVGVWYGAISALRDVSVEVNQGDFVAILGANGAGKSSLLKAIAGLVPVSQGTMHLNDRDVTQLRAQHRLPLGVVYVPEGRHLFPFLSVEENLLLGSWTSSLRKTRRQRLEALLNTVPLLAERRAQLAGTLSGGQQQMVAVGRALMSAPQLLLLDEPSLGLSPLAMKDVMALVEATHHAGTTVVLVEQNAGLALEVCDRAYVLADGRCVKSGPASVLRGDEEVRAAYLGV